MQHARPRAGGNPSTESGDDPARMGRGWIGMPWTDCAPLARVKAPDDYIALPPTPVPPIPSSPIRETASAKSPRCAWSLISSQNPHIHTLWSHAWLARSKDEIRTVTACTPAHSRQADHVSKQSTCARFHFVCSYLGIDTSKRFSNFRQQASCEPSFVCKRKGRRMYETLTEAD